MGKYDIYMVRHGESEWNDKNLFCGWYDAVLSEKGYEEAVNAGKYLKEANVKFDCAHTSVLTRAKKTLEAILVVTEQLDIPVYETWRLNERHYGALTGLNKSETAIKYGETQVQIWRRSFDVPPPAMGEDHLYYNEIVNDPRYAKGPSREEFPLGESLKKTMERTMPYWNKTILPQIKEGKRILIVAHGNSLRGIIKGLMKLSDEEIMLLNLPTGVPFMYTLNENLEPIAPMKFLGDEETVKKAIEAVVNQGKAK
ncbi:Phosphoglycerate mutase, putative [Pediculus humanus corporis]|uniref:Phosphoglycerate mutase n=1 Tax=Pediculus humanus subsp. corporis TaxID=121224 RepID=E0VNK0_PEDHC|nr:Phosphoglycerate mutase, putative [Pediculus humanus corporis]EEB14956.1 Phosphoglycerate mutase, putative [Pediculus humanus corporis]